MALCCCRSTSGVRVPAAEEGAAWGCVPWSKRNGTVQGLNKPPGCEPSLHGTKRRAKQEERTPEMFQHKAWGQAEP